MAGMEVVVRPVVFPNIRPAPAQSRPPEDDPTKGFVVIHGNGAQQISISNSYSSSTTTSARSETKRRVDEARVYQMDDNGEVNKSNYVDLEVANKIWMKGAPSPARVKDAGVTEPGFVGTQKEVFHYDGIKEKDNIEIRKKNVIKRKGEES